MSNIIVSLRLILFFNTTQKSMDLNPGEQHSFKNKLANPFLAITVLILVLVLEILSSLPGDNTKPKDWILKRMPGKKP